MTGEMLPTGRDSHGLEALGHGCAQRGHALGIFTEGSDTDYGVVRVVVDVEDWREVQIDPEAP